MSNSREILTLQFGHYSNFIGTHWWNSQESSFDYSGQSVSEVNHDILFREGQTARGEVTYTPRLLLVDLKDSLKQLPEQGDLYEPLLNPNTVEVPWPKDALEIQKSEKTEKNQFQLDLEISQQELNARKYNLESDIKVWSDFLYTRYHPKTINIIRDYKHESSDSQFNVYNLGTSLWKTPYFDDFSDKIRSYVEECDSLQGFQIILDSTDGFAGLSNSCIQHLHDEYDNKSVLAFPVIPSHYSDYNYSSARDREQSTAMDSLRLINLALCYSNLSDTSSVFVPLCTGTKGWRQPGPKREFNHLNFNSELYYHTSAILATAMDTFTLRYRRKSFVSSVSDLCADLSAFGRKAACASLGLPFEMKENTDFIDSLDQWEGPLFQCITPNCTIGTDRIMQIITLRGISENILKRPPQQAKKQREMAAYRCETVKEMLDLYLACNSFATASDVIIDRKPFTVKTPYPSIFTDYVNKNGFISNEKRSSDISISSVPVIAGLHSGSGVGNMLEKLAREAGRLKISRFYQFHNEGLEADEYKECINQLMALRECYEESYE